MRKAIITIPTPCHENWDAMTPAEKRRFCHSCQKHVYDFTNSSDRQILEKFSSEKNICGRFLHSQLDRELSVPKEKKPLWIAAAGIIAFLNPGVKVYAQDKPQIVQTDDKVQVKEKMIEPQNGKMISGVVSDATGTLPGANVAVKGTTRSVQTDLDGKFNIMVQENDTLVFSFVGMQEKQIKVTSGTIDIKLENSLPLDQVVTMGGVFIKKSTFSGRDFLRLANWFRSGDKKRY